MENKEVAKDENIKPKKTSLFEKIVEYTAAIIGFLIGKYFGFLGILLFIGPIILGDYIPNWYMKRENINYKLIKFIGWSNVCTWILPPLGIFTGTLSVKFASYDNKQKIKYRVLGVIGIIFSLANAVVGILLRM